MSGELVRDRCYHNVFIVHHGAAFTTLMKHKLVPALPELPNENERKREKRKR